MFYQRPWIWNVGFPSKRERKKLDQNTDLSVLCTSPRKWIILPPGVALPLPLCSKLSWVFYSYKGCLSKPKPHFKRKSLKWPLKPFATPKLHPASEHIGDWAYPSPKKPCYCCFCGLKRDHRWVSFFLHLCSINIAWPRPISEEAWVPERDIMKASNRTTSFRKSWELSQFCLVLPGPKFRPCFVLSPCWTGRDRTTKQVKILSRAQNSFSKLEKLCFRSL